MEDIKARKLREAAADAHADDDGATAPLQHRSRSKSPPKSPPRTAITAASGVPASGAADRTATASDSPPPAGDVEAPPLPPPPPRPSVHPKLSESHHSQQDTEVVMRQFSAAASNGIRALPNALHPDFRLQLYGALVILGKERQMALREKRAHAISGGAGKETMTAHDLELAAATALLLAHSTKGGPLQEPVRLPWRCDRPHAHM